jgi:hypothetical protein
MDERLKVVWKNGMGAELQSAVAENDEQVKAQLIKMITEGEVCVNDTFTVEEE